jgi:periplasmic divalent cation tolerance protein
MADLEVQYLQVQTTTDSRAEAMELSRAAVEARLAACAQVAGPVASMYWWDGALERTEEWLVLFKLAADRYDELAAFITEQHSYDEPEIVALPIVAGSTAYLSWLREETRPAQDASERLGTRASAARPRAHPALPRHRHRAAGRGGVGSRPDRRRHHLAPRAREGRRRRPRPVD